MINNIVPPKNQIVYAQPTAGDATLHWYFNGANGVLFVNAATKYAALTLVLPRTFKTLVKASAFIAPLDAGNMYAKVDTSWGKNTEDLAAHMDTIAYAAYAVQSSKWYEWDILAAFTDVAAEDIIGITITRDAANVLDTVEASIGLCGVSLEFTV
jgi:hypothetical protein